MNRPKIILNMFASVDGRITTGPGRNVAEWTKYGIDGGANEATHRLYDDLDCDGLLSGSESLVVYGKHAVQLQQDVYWPKKSNAYIVFDGSGKIEWGQSQGLLVVTRENVSASYIRQLKDKQIPYLQAGGDDHIDVRKALDMLHAQGFWRIGLTGGGTINGVFLRQGLIDEISIIYAPVAVGGIHAPTIFDADDLLDPGLLTRLELIQVKPLLKDLVWVHYAVKHRRDT